ncbi:hypothetical protein SEA_MORGANA_168 [Gordonia phage Morgana]|uniref:Uncharacterized protein n=1 Tax=Gordonia phage Morgana TaxID=3137292 RepID=A0AAX4RBB9_9CAUD
MSCPHDQIALVHHENPYSHGVMSASKWGDVYLSMVTHIGESALNRSLVRAEGDHERGTYVIDDGEMLLHYLWHTDTGPECEAHAEGCICECCDPVDPNIVGGVDPAEFEVTHA